MDGERKESCKIFVNYFVATSLGSTYAYCFGNKLLWLGNHYWQILKRCDHTNCTSVLFVFTFYIEAVPIQKGFKYRTGRGDGCKFKSFPTCAEIRLSSTFKVFEFITVQLYIMDRGC